MPVSAAAQIAIPNILRSRLPWRTTVGWRLLESRKSPTTPASCGPAGAGVCAGRCAGAAASAAATTSGSPMYGTRASLAILILLRGACAPRAPAVSGPGRAKSNRAGRLDGVADAEAEGEHETGQQQERQGAPHDGIPQAVGDVPEDHGPQRVANEEGGAEDADHAAPAGLRGDVHQERRERRVEEAVGAAREQAGQERSEERRVGK